MEPELLLAATIAVGLAVVFAPPRVPRANLLTWGLLGLARVSTLPQLRRLDLVLLILLPRARVKPALVGVRGRGRHGRDSGSPQPRPRPPDPSRAGRAADAGGLASD